MLAIARRLLKLAWWTALLRLVSAAAVYLCAIQVATIRVDAAKAHQTVTGLDVTLVAKSKLAGKLEITGLPAGVYGVPRLGRTGSQVSKISLGKGQTTADQQISEGVLALWQTQ